MSPENTQNEVQTRKEIDKNLKACGWVIQDKSRINLYESLGVAVREMDTDTGPADYMLFIDGKACGIIEAKREGTDLGGVAEQSGRYAASNTKHIERWAADDQALPFLYEATNHEIRFRDERDPHPRSRFVFHFHKPETFKAWLDEGDAAPGGPSSRDISTSMYKTLRGRFNDLPELNTDPLRLCQIAAIHGIEKSLKAGKPRALLQMATGSGKTYTAVTQVYRLAKFAKAKRILFLVDRGNLGTNAKDEFEQFVIPHDGRKFTQHYDVQGCTSVASAGRAGATDDHCDCIVDAVREVFDEGNAFCKKITYKIGKREAEEAIKAFRTDPQYRISVTVDMIATGTDIKPLECVMFMRDVKSQSYYEQMKGRGTRVISLDELHKVTPDAPGKSRFVLVDCVGVTETDKTETKSLETKPSVSTAKLMEQIARGDRNSETLRALGNRLIRLDLKLNDQQRKYINSVIHETLGTSKPLALIAGELIHATNEEPLIEAAKIHAKTEEPTEKQIQEAFKPKADILIKPFHNPDLRELIEELRKNTDQLIDDSADELLSAGYDEEKAEVLIKNWKQFIQDHKNELDAIQLIYQQPYQTRHLSYEQIEKLAEEIQQPPYNLAPIEVWKAYEQLEKNKVKGVPPRELLTNIVSLIRFSTGLSDVLEPFTELVNNRFDNWLKQQGKEFKPDQLDWLNKIKDQIAQNAEMTVEDFNYIPFNQEGGLLKARELFGKELEPLISELNGYLIA